MSLILLPPMLREYFIDDIKLDNAEQVERMLTRDEEQRMEAYNRQFARLRKDDFVPTNYFEPMERSKNNLMTLTDVKRHLQSRLCVTDMPSPKELSRSLGECFQAGAMDGRRGWYIRVKVKSE